MNVCLISCVFLAHYLRHLNRCTAQKATIHQVATMLATSKNVLLPGHKHLLTPVLMTRHFDYRPNASEMKGHQYLWLAGGYDPEIGLF